MKNKNFKNYQRDDKNKLKKLKSYVLSIENGFLKLIKERGEKIGYQTMLKEYTGKENIKERVDKWIGIDKLSNEDKNRVVDSINNCINQHYPSEIVINLILAISSTVLYLPEKYQSEKLNNILKAYEKNERLIESISKSNPETGGKFVRCLTYLSWLNSMNFNDIAKVFEEQSNEDATIDKIVDVVIETLKKTPEDFYNLVETLTKAKRNKKRRILETLEFYYINRLR